MRIYFICGCGLINYNIEDWISHFKYRGVKKGLILLLKMSTRMEAKDREKTFMLPEVQELQLEQ
jgi:hypothetical protein